MCWYCSCYSMTTLQYLTDFWNWLEIVRVMERWCAVPGRGGEQNRIYNVVQILEDPMHIGLYYRGGDRRLSEERDCLCWKVAYALFINHLQNILTRWMQIPTVLYYLPAYPGSHWTIMRYIAFHENAVSLMMVRLESKHFGTCMM